MSFSLVSFSLVSGANGICRRLRLRRLGSIIGMWCRDGKKRRRVKEMMKGRRPLDIILERYDTFNVLFLLFLVLSPTTLLYVFSVKSRHGYKSLHEN